MNQITTTKIFFIPPLLWRRIFADCYHSKNDERRYRAQREDAIFVWFVALKCTCKQLNLLLDDNFFLKAVSQPTINLLRVFKKKRLSFIIKRGSFKAFADLRAILSHDIRINFNGLLLLATQFRDTAFVEAFLRSAPKPVFFIRTMIIALRNASNREMNDMIITLLPHFVRICGAHEEDLDMVIKELKAGKKLNLDNFIGLDEYLHRNYYLRDRKLNSRFFLDMLDPSLNRQAIVVVPQGELTHLKLTGSRSQLTMGSSNMCVQDKYADRCLIIYRERYRKEYQEILIKKQTNDTGITYTFDEVTTSNLYGLIVKSSLAEKIFRTYPHMYVAITKEAMDLPLDEQPWFVGYLDNYERNELASGAPNKASFFTYCNAEGDFYLQWTETDESRRDSAKAYINNIKLNRSDKIQKYVYSSQIVFGISNYRHQKNLVKYKTMKYVIENNFDKMKQWFTENNIDVMSLGRPNLVRLCVAQKTINEEILFWLMNNGAPLGYSYFEKDFEIKIISNCSEKVIKKLFERKDEISLNLVIQLMSRQVSFELMKFAFEKVIKTLTTDNRMKLITTLCTNITKKILKYEDYTKRVLVAAAWQYGNEDNWFKMLPKELIEKILNYENIDEPLYFQLLYSLAKNMTEDDYKSLCSEELDPFMPFFWKYWGTLYSSKMALHLVQKIMRSDFKDMEITSRLFYWLQRLVTRMPRSEILSCLTFIANEKLASNIVQYCVEISTEGSVHMLDFLLKHKLIRRELLLDPHYGKRYDNGTPVPMARVAVLENRMNVINWLVKEDLLLDGNK